MVSGLAQGSVPLPPLHHYIFISIFCSALRFTRIPSFFSGVAEAPSVLPITFLSLFESEKQNPRFSGEHLAAIQHQNYISLQIDVAMLLHSGQWDVRGRSLHNFQALFFLSLSCWQNTIAMARSPRGDFGMGSHAQRSNHKEAWVLRTPCPHLSELTTTGFLGHLSTFNQALLKFQGLCNKGSL